jgi:hypothetical protein
MPLADNGNALVSAEDSLYGLRKISENIWFNVMHRFQIESTSKKDFNSDFIVNHFVNLWQKSSPLNQQTSKKANKANEYVWIIVCARPMRPMKRAKGRTISDSNTNISKHLRYRAKYFPASLILGIRDLLVLPCLHDPAEMGQQI